MTLNLMRVLQSSAAATTANSSSAAKPSSGELIWIIYWLIALLGSILSSLFLLLHSLHFLSLSVSLFPFSVPPPFLLSLPFSFFLAVPPHFVYISSPFPFYMYSKTAHGHTYSDLCGKYMVNSLSIFMLLYRQQEHELQDSEAENSILLSHSL